jgi:hypothetical protein
MPADRDPAMTISVWRIDADEMKVSLHPMD